MSTFDTDVQIQKQYPAVEYEPNLLDEPSGLWQEDHEIDGTMYRATNATFNEGLGTWGLPPGSPGFPAYCKAAAKKGPLSTDVSFGIMPKSTAL
jgi:hypothetical protein